MDLQREQEHHTTSRGGGSREDMMVMDRLEYLVYVTFYKCIFMLIELEMLVQLPYFVVGLLNDV